LVLHFIWDYNDYVGGADNNMKKRKKICVYVRNAMINPSGYYRIYQYVKYLDEDYTIIFRNIVGDRIYSLDRTL
jgi:hypothetical protein